MKTKAKINERVKGSNPCNKTIFNYSGHFNYK